jgi:hypothetical protein
MLIELEHTLHAEKLINKPNDVFKIDERNGFKTDTTTPTARPTVFRPKIQNRFDEDEDVDQSDLIFQRTTPQQPVQRTSQQIPDDER